MRPTRLVPLALTLLLPSACVTGSTRAPQAGPGCKARPSLDTPLGESGQPAPLIVELPIAQLNPLARALEGEQLALVRYEGCSLEVLRGCGAAGSYTWSADPPSSYELSLATRASLDAQVPLGAGSLGPMLDELGPLNMLLTSVGRYLAPLEGLAPSGSECERATHVVAQVLVGAWAVSAAGSVRVDVDAEVHGGTVSGSAFEQYAFARSEGDPAACASATGASADGPAHNCRSLLQVELVELPLAP